MATVADPTERDDLMGDRSGDAIMVVNGGKEEMNVTLKCWAEQHL